MSELSEGPPGKLPLGERLRQLPLANSSRPGSAPPCPPRGAVSSVAPQLICREHDAENIAAAQNEYASRLMYTAHTSNTKPPLLASPSIHAGQGVPTASPEEAALAAGALAELRASVSVVVRRLDIIEKEFADDAGQRHDLSGVLEQHRCKQAALSNHVCTVSESCERLASELEESMAELRKRFDSRDSQVLNVQRSCKDVTDSCATIATRVDTLTGTCSRSSAQLADFQSQWGSKCQHIDTRILGLEKSCIDLQELVADASEMVRGESQRSSAHDDLDGRLTDLDLRFEKQCSLFKTFQNVLHQQGASYERVSQALEAVAKSENIYNDLRQSLASLEEDSKRLRRNADSRLGVLEAFHSDLVKEREPVNTAFTVNSSEQQLPGTASKVSVSWEVEARIREISEEVYAASEQAVTTYIGAVRAELSQRVESIVQECMDKAPIPTNPLEYSLSCSDAFLDEALVAAHDAPRGQDDGAAILEAAAPKSAASLVQQQRLAAGAAGALPVWRDGGTGSCQHDAARLALAQSSSSAASSASVVISRPAGERQQGPPAGARRLRSASPGLRLPDGTPNPPPQLRAPSSPPCLEGAATD